MNDGDIYLANCGCFNEKCYFIDHNLVFHNFKIFYSMKLMNKIAYNDLLEL